jgi:hypothetical protein
MWIWIICVVIVIIITIAVVEIKKWQRRQNVRQNRLARWSHLPEFVDLSDERAHTINALNLEVRR